MRFGAFGRPGAIGKYPSARLLVSFAFDRGALDGDEPGCQIPGRDQHAGGVVHQSWRDHAPGRTHHCICQGLSHKCGRAYGSVRLARKVFDTSHDPSSWSSFAPCREALRQPGADHRAASPPLRGAPCDSQWPRRASCLRCSSFYASSYQCWPTGQHQVCPAARGARHAVRGPRHQPRAHGGPRG